MQSSSQTHAALTLFQRTCKNSSAIPWVLLWKILESYQFTVKSNRWEPCLTHLRSFQDRRATTQIRSSSHHLRIERGRYNKTPLDERTCNYWELNSNQLFIENDNHMLHSCSIPAPLLGKDPRDKFQNLSEILLNIVSNLYLFYIQQSISSEWVIVQVLRYIHIYTIKLRVPRGVVQK